ncbi:hypothetical protein P879_07696 [Paragonimus westermani]|uniref:Peptidase M12B domain-containing protein n=1 Tax=Paragonimus westermani TaxID=34504 RepID=A0A8T0D856_9TREM|nr:hypothetical protein P879_07696 [Paragonimus westermani]
MVYLTGLVCAGLLLFTDCLRQHHLDTLHKTSDDDSGVEREKEAEEAFWTSSEPPSPVHQHYWIETLVFADHTVKQRFSTLGQAQTYVQTLMRMTNDLFHHPSLGANLSLIVREIIWISEKESNELLWGPSLIRSVHRFCNWALVQHYVRYNYDHALFISRNIVQAAGISPLGQMCQMQYSCTLAEDSGFFSAYPIAHELMHSLSVEHDGEGNGCDQSGLTGNIMAPLILSASHNHHWSDCTRLVLKAAINSQKFTCLEDYPIDERKFALREPPGRYWNLDEQCHVLTGSNVSRHCPGVEEHTCQELWCSITGSIDQCDRMLNHGLLDGTTCDPGKVSHYTSQYILSVDCVRVGPLVLRRSYNMLIRPTSTVPT